MECGLFEDNICAENPDVEEGSIDSRLDDDNDPGEKEEVETVETALKRVYGNLFDYNGVFEDLTLSYDPEEYSPTEEDYLSRILIIDDEVKNDFKKPEDEEEPEERTEDSDVNNANEDGEETDDSGLEDGILDDHEFRLTA